jgi:CheY-like chemotaxis protein
MPLNKTIPVVVLSAREVSEAKRKSIDAGAVAYFQKPAAPRKLLLAITIAAIPSGCSGPATDLISPRRTGIAMRRPAPRCI